MRGEHKDLGLTRKRLRPQVSGLERDFGSHLEIADALKALTLTLLEHQPASPGEREAWRYGVYQEARSALRASDKALSLALALRSLLANESKLSSLDLRIGCDEIVRDVGVLVGQEPDRAFAEEVRRSLALCHMWAGRNNKFRLCAALYTFGNAHRGGLDIFTRASESRAKRLYRIGVDIAREECERNKYDVSWKMLLNAGLRHFVQLRACDLGEYDEELERDVEQMRNLANDNIGTPLVRLSTEFAVGRYHVALARTAADRRSHLDKAEGAVEAAERERPNSVVTPWMDLMCRVGRIELLVAQGHVSRAEDLMRQFYTIATKYESLYHVKFYEEWQQAYGVEPLTNTRHGGQLQRWSEGRIAELERKVGQQALEIDFLKGCLQRIEEQRMLQALTGSPRSTRKSNRK